MYTEVLFFFSAIGVFNIICLLINQKALNIFLFIGLFLLLVSI